MKYERLTKRTKRGIAYVDFTHEDIAVIEHFAAIEDKIENGTLIDTKVKIGQRVYMRGFFKGDIDEYIVINITLENGELEFHLKHDFDEHKTCYSVTVFTLKEFEEKVFLTKAEAEKKVKEWQNEESK